MSTHSDSLAARLARLEQLVLPTASPVDAPATPGGLARRVAALEQGVAAAERRLVEQAQASLEDLAPGSECQLDDGRGSWVDVIVQAVQTDAIQVQVKDTDDRREAQLNQLRPCPVDLGVVPDARQRLAELLPQEVLLTPEAKLAVVNLRAGDLTSATDQATRVRALEQFVASPAVEAMAERAPELERACAESDRSTREARVLRAKVHHMLDQHAAMVTLLNEKMVVWDEAIRKHEQRRQAPSV